MNEDTPSNTRYARSEYHTQLAKVSFDEIFDSQLECYIVFYQIYSQCVLYRCAALQSGYWLADFKSPTRFWLADSKQTCRITAVWRVHLGSKKVTRAAEITGHPLSLVFTKATCFYRKPLQWIPRLKSAPLTSRNKRSSLHIALICGGKYIPGSFCIGGTSDLTTLNTQYPSLY